MTLAPGQCLEILVAAFEVPSLVKLAGRRRSEIIRDEPAADGLRRLVARRSGP